MFSFSKTFTPCPLLRIFIKLTFLFFTVTNECTEVIKDEASVIAIMSASYFSPCSPFYFCTPEINPSHLSPL